ncbi:putative ctr copper transporter [Emericellopsis cladophorae]|uniref:Copper transport protein n=1 Tax=Emericellopsis cladophorae TaxID=2686198 RepID=A0A9Q0BES8_9HYPO|nr:putative ctr copper transporter [Emericellopsis cladophorae]KAI6782752.1 putative ctr copper transporter [Emericellopsis cladophorae]
MSLPRHEGPNHGADMSGVDMGGDNTTGTGSSKSTSSMSGMSMTFFLSSRTPLLSTQWTPATDGQYAGTCIFLLSLAVLLRVLLALRPILETRLWRRTAAAASEAVAQSEVDDEKVRLLAGQPRQSLAIVKRDVQRKWSGWRVSVATARATYELFVAGIGYLLMLAVMTMNLGYFLSVLSGVWLGTFVLGGLSFDDTGSIHC